MKTVHVDLDSLALLQSCHLKTRLNLLVQES